MDGIRKHLSPEIDHSSSYAGSNKPIVEEDISNRKQEQSILLSLSNSFAAVRSKSDLMQVLSTTLKQLFPISGFGITLLNEDAKSHSPFVVESEERIKNDADFKKVTKFTYSTEDGVFNRITLADEPVILNVDELEVKRAAYVDFWKKMNVKQVMGIKLNAANKYLGCLIVHLLPGSSDSLSLNLFKTVSAQISVAVSNIHANEEILKREKENSILLSLSNDMAALRNRDDLFQNVNPTIKKILSYEKLGIAHISEDRNYHSAFMMDLGDKVKYHLDFIKITTQKYDVNDPVFSHIMNSPDPVILDVNDLKKKPGIPPYVHFWKAVNFAFLLCVPLRVGGNDIGVVFFDVGAETKVNLRSNLLKGVCAQLAVAISNILRNEEIARREKERELLLSLNIEIAAARNSNDLLNVISRKLKDLLGFTHTVIATINDDQSKLSAFILDNDSKSKQHPQYKEASGKSYPINDQVLKKVFSSSEPVVFDLKQIYKENKLPLYLQINFDSGINYAVLVKFSDGANVYGVWMILFDSAQQPEPDQLRLIDGLSYQISIAVLNIIANQEIQYREDEKSLLLHFSNSIASAKGNEELGKIIKQQLKDLFSIEDYLINQLSSDKKTFIPLLYDPDALFINDPSFQQILNVPSNVNDGIFNQILKSEEPITFDATQWSLLKEPPLYSETANVIGLKRMTGVRIRMGQEDIAILNFRHDDFELTPNQYHLLKSICSQIAITISNLIANNDIKNREEEKSKLLEFSNAIASVREKDVLAKILKAQLKNLFAIEDYVIHAISKNKKKHWPVLFDHEADFAAHPDFKKLVGVESDVNDGVFNVILNSAEPVIFKVEDWLHSSRPPSYAKAANDIKLETMACVSIRLGKEIIAVMNFKQDASNQFATKKPLFKSICSQLAIAISNIIANEKIEKQLHEIEHYKQQLEEEKIYLQEEIETSQNYSEIIGYSDAMKKVFHLVTQVAKSDSTVLILGETGTGKELIARAIHNGSPRSQKLMVKVNCAALPSNLIESELFGHERGSFTGATERRIGKFEIANGGTLFLDEIGEMPLELQVKLLRALQEREIERVGGRTSFKVDVRIIAATNRDLEKMMEEGKFRNDLYYRLNIFPINLPPLRSRTEDIPVLAMHFIKRFAKKAGKKITTFSNKVLKEFIQYSWPGNIRELEHIIERSVLLTNGDTIKEIHLPTTKGKMLTESQNPEPLLSTIDDNERHHILMILKHCNGKISGTDGAAEILGVPPSTLTSKMKRLGIKKEHFIQALKN